jgi:glycosyltransferase involved in cell wall biosynthesis
LGETVVLFVAGDGPQKKDLELEALRKGVRRNIRFLGFRNDIPDLLAACDIVALPSIREGLSISLLEAMAAGKPVIATDIGSNREATNDGLGALLVPPSDSRALADSILRLSKDYTLRAELGATAKAIFLSRYTEEGMLRQYGKLYLDLVNEKDPRVLNATG